MCAVEGLVAITAVNVNSSASKDGSLKQIARTSTGTAVEAIYNSQLRFWTCKLAGAFQVPLTC